MTSLNDYFFKFMTKSRCPCFSSLQSNRLDATLLQSKSFCEAHLKPLPQVALTSTSNYIFMKMSQIYNYLHQQIPNICHQHILQWQSITKFFFMPSGKRSYQ